MMKDNHQLKDQNNVKMTQEYFKKLFVVYDVVLFITRESILVAVRSTRSSLSDAIISE